MALCVVGRHVVDLGVATLCVTYIRVRAPLVVAPRMSGAMQSAHTTNADIANCLSVTSTRG